MQGKISRNAEICKLVDAGMTYQELSDKFGISKAAIGAIVHRDRRLAGIYNESTVGRLLFEACENLQCRDYISIYNALHRHFGRKSLCMDDIANFYYSGGHIRNIGCVKERVIFEMLRLSDDIR